MSGHATERASALLLPLDALARLFELLLRNAAVLGRIACGSHLH
jgi:hypothetical protein